MCKIFFVKWFFRDKKKQIGECLNESAKLSLKQKYRHKRHEEQLIFLT